MEKQTTLRSINGIIRAKIRATDGDIGKVRDFLFDDERWTLRYVVADTGNWLTGRKVLLSPFSLGDPDLVRMTSEIPVKLSRKQIEEAPPLDADAPVSRRYEQQLARYYALPPYWGSNSLWGFRQHPAETIPFTPEEIAEQEKPFADIKECHLRSVKEVDGYHIQALDGLIGHVRDFLAHQQSWAIRFLVVDTKNWWPGKRVLISPAKAREVNWQARRVQLQMKRDQIKQSPEYHPDQPVSIDLEELTLAHYGYSEIP